MLLFVLCSVFLVIPIAIFNMCVFRFCKSYYLLITQDILNFTFLLKCILLLAGAIVLWLVCAALEVPTILLLCSYKSANLHLFLYFSLFLHICFFYVTIFSTFFTIAVGRRD